MRDAAPQSEASTPSTRNRIVAASFQLFLQHGFSGTGLSQILAASGLSKGAFYHYFSSKDDLYREVISIFFLQPIQNFDFEKLASQPLNDSRGFLAEVYEQLPEAVAAAGIDMARYFALFFEAFSRLDDFRAEVRTYYAGLLKGLAQRTYEEREIFPKVADTFARNVIAQLEGKLFLAAIFGPDGPGVLVSTAPE